MLNWRLVNVITKKNHNSIYVLTCIELYTKILSLGIKVNSRYTVPIVRFLL